MKQTNRFLIYFAGMLLLALGIILNAKTGLGVSPLVSVAYCASELTGLDFSNMSMALYALCFLAEVAVKGRSTRWFDVIQLPFCFLMTRFMSLFSRALPNPEGLPLRVLLLVFAIIFTGTGVALMLHMRLVPNPSDGLVQAVSDRTGKSVGFIKNCLDALCVLITLCLGLLAARRVIGIGAGTVAAVILTGRVVAVTTRFFGSRLDRIVKSAPIAFLGD